MPPIQTRVSHFIRWSSRRGDAYVRTIAPDLSEKTQQRTGLVLGIVKIEAVGHVGDALVAHIEDALVRGLSEATRKLPVTAGQEEIFEAAVSKVNDSLSRIVGEKRLPVSMDAITGILLSQRGLDVVAAAWGQPTMLLFHPTKNNDIKIFDLLEEDGSNPPKTKIGPPKRGFLHLITGRIGCGDKMFICTEDLRQTLGADELAPIIADNDPDTATAILHDVFAARKDTAPLALYVTDAIERTKSDEDEDELRSAKRLSSATQRSIEKLLTTESETRSIMSPSFIPSLLKKIGSAAAEGAETVRAAFQKMPEDETADDADIAEMTAVAPELPEAEAEEGEARSEETDLPGSAAIAEITETEMVMRSEPEEPAQAAPPEPEPAQAAPKQPPAALQAAVKTLRRTGGAIKKAVSTMISKEKRRSAWQRIRTGNDRAVARVIEKFNGLSLTSRYLLLAVLAVVFIFNCSITFASWQRYREETVAAYDRTVTAVQQKIDSAEASLIYRDEDRARNLLQEATALIAALPGKSQTQKMIKEALTKKVEAKYEAIRREVRLGAPEVVANIATGQAEAPTLIRMTTSAGTVWAASAGGEVFKISLQDGASTKVGDIPNGASPTIFLTDGRTVLAGGGGRLAAIAVSGAVSERTVDLGDIEAEIADADVYNGRLYLLDPTHNRILRADPAAKGYARPQFYLKDGTDVSRAVSMTIDGMVYVLMQNGAVIKLTKGERIAFDAGAVDPAVTAAKRIRSRAESDHIYVLDASPFRLICFDKKTGAMIAQYVSPALNGAADFLIDEETRTALVAVGSQVLRFALPELK